ncbi:erythromycin esterase family protein [Nocardia sp. NPDC050710]|uniref:erythromycin esterase family protein n=1 Tax=Nocardia sp. NPDC050710 TaxID=3157220 RepID=UPI0033E27EB7
MYPQASVSGPDSVVDICFTSNCLCLQSQLALQSKTSLVATQLSCPALGRGVEYGVADRLTLAAMSQEFPTTGSLLRKRFGTGYLSVAVTFHHGQVRADMDIPAPAKDFADIVLDLPERENYVLDLRNPPADAVQRWRHEPAKLRLVIETLRPGPRCRPLHRWCRPG